MLFWASASDLLWCHRKLLHVSAWMQTYPTLWNRLWVSVSVPIRQNQKTKERFSSVSLHYLLLDNLSIERLLLRCTGSCKLWCSHIDCRLFILQPQIIKSFDFSSGLSGNTKLSLEPRICSCFVGKVLDSFLSVSHVVLDCLKSGVSLFLLIGLVLFSGLTDISGEILPILSKITDKHSIAEVQSLHCFRQIRNKIRYASLSLHRRHAFNCINSCSLRTLSVGWSNGFHSSCLSRLRSLIGLAALHQSCCNSCLKVLLESRRQIWGILNYDILHSFLYLLRREVFEVSVCKHVSKAHHLVVISVRIQQSASNSRLRIYSISLRACAWTQYASCRLQGTLATFNTCQQRNGQHVCKDILDDCISIRIFNKSAEQALPYSILCLYSFCAEDVQSLCFLLQRLLAPAYILCLL